MTTIWGNQKKYQSNIYEMKLRTTNGKLVKVCLYELPSITGKIYLFNRSIVEGLFPNFDPNMEVRGSQHMTYFELHPK